MVDPDGRLRRARAAVPDHRSMPQRRSRLARGGVQPLQDTGSLPLDAIRRPRDTPIWKLEASLKCRSCRRVALRRR